ncbi:MAG: hypothetical protein LBH43_20005 [Treponema sp.]|nr:hypothetical protein [Treponema sp.]
MNNKKVFEKFEEENLFIKTTVPSTMDAAQKAVLNRKGNLLFNKGDVETARRIFMTTGYSDGLSRVGDYYKSQARPVDALRMYWIAPDHTKSDPIIEQLSDLLQLFIHEEEPSDE